MFKLNNREMAFIALVLEGFFYGLYSGIFAMFLWYQAPKKDGDKKQNFVFYPMSTLYVLSVALFVVNTMICTYALLEKPVDSLLHLNFAQTMLFGCCDFIAQFILIYRCWIVWSRNIRVVIIPSILAFAFLVIWLVGNSLYSISSGGIIIPTWAYWMTMSGLALSLIVNALVTGLIVFKIVKVFWKVKTTSDPQFLGATDGSKVRRTIFVLIESGMALFSIQLIRLVVSTMKQDAAFRAYLIVSSIQDMLNVITALVILLLTILLITWVLLGHNTYHDSGANLNGTVFPRREIYGRSCWHELCV